MCDIFYPECRAEGCAVRASIHLADFLTKRDEVEIYCWNHIPEDISDGVLYDVDDEVVGELPGYKGKLFIRALTDNAKNRWLGNHYNGDDKIIAVFGKTGKAKDESVKRVEKEHRDYVIQRIEELKKKE